MNKNELRRSYIFYYILAGIMFLSNSLSTTLINGKISLILAILWIVISLICYYLIKNNEKGLRFYSIINAIIAGVSMSSYYVLKNIEPLNPVVSLGVLGVVMIIHYSFMKKIKNKETFLKTEIALIVLCIIASIYVWIMHNSTYGSGFVFVSIIFLCLNISLLLFNKKETSHAKIVGFTSLIMFAGILVSVIIALIEGEVIEILDIDIWGRKKKRLNS
ncbi:hypothetical protein [Alkaliphilus serpentinus]|uniref:Uncharacterized protein n=1 Tax=Alkaliphilus serpentinus TaxID=1482731 RepID=A0A833MEP8_9FIRM|nr:hypothetical protein [Alkaliphilus serpentinus]KAB3531594.1 hypothetical protein F8153_05315 [Alkaliphilus serpentinus]